MNRLFALALVLAAGTLAAIPDDAAGCAAVPRDGERVDTTEESALIVWDDKAKVEHFIRRANFRATGSDFGFLVPTPNRPELDVATDDLFAELARITAPKVEYREVVREVPKEFPLGCTRPGASQAELAGNESMSKAGGVEVLEQKRVGDYDATILAFRRGDNDTPERGAAELAKWLAKHGYASSLAIETWLKQYVDDQWCITAFKIASPEKPAGAKASSDRHALRAKPIRMSFKAERPFYPYREPETAPAATPDARLLRVFLAAPARYAGKLGDGSKSWPGHTMWAGPLGASQWANLFQKVTQTDLPTKGSNRPPALPAATDGLWLTEFEDLSSPRPGTDEVYFEPAADSAELARPPHMIISTRTVMVTPWWHMAVYFGVPAAILLGGLLSWRVLRRT